MLGFGETAAKPSGGYVTEGSEATFMDDVIAASEQVPVIVDFWAPWCGPCKTLGPALEAAVNKAGGKVRMVKIDVDRNQQIAAQLRIQSIPTVYAFWQGQPVDGFQGAIPPGEIAQFVDKLTKLAGDAPGDGIAEALDSAEAALEQGAVTDAVQVFGAVLTHEPTNARAHAGMVASQLAVGDLDRAEAVLANVPAEITTAPEIEAVRARVELARAAADAGPVTELAARVEADPNDHTARLDLAIALHAAGQTEAAIDHLLDLFARDREWNEGAARNQLIKIFDALPAKDPVALKGRRRLSSMMFA